jgi:hypothetical protein
MRTDITSVTVLFVSNSNYLFFPVALQSLKNPGRLTYKRFLELFRQMVELLG